MARREWLSLILKYLLGLAVLSAVVWWHWHPKVGATGPGIAEALRGNVRFWPLAVAGLLTAIAASFAIVRWYILVRAQDLPLSLRETYRYGLIAYFWNSVLPGGIGGDLVKAGMLVMSEGRRTAKVSSIVFDRAVGLTGLIVLVVVSAGVHWCAGSGVLAEQAGLARIVWLSVYILVGLTIGWVLLGFLPELRAERFARRLHRIPKLGGPISELWRAAWIYRKKPMAVLAALALATGLHVFNVVAFHFAAKVFANDPAVLPTLPEHFLFIPVGIAFRALFPSPGGAGAELGFGTLYEIAGRPAAYGVLASLAILLITWILGAIAYFVGTHLRPTLPAQKEIAEQSLESPTPK